GLVLGEQEGLVVAGHLGGAGHHDPVLGAVVVHLQRQLRAGAHGDVLDLVAVAVVHRVVAAPGAVDGAVALGLLAVPGVQGVDQLLDVLHRALVGDHHGVLGLHHHHVVHADQGDQLGRAVHEAVVAVVGDHIALEHVAVAVLLLHVPQRGPGADVVPAGGQRHHAGAAGLLHHRIVDGIVRAALEGAGVDGQHAVARLAALQGQHAGVVDVRLVG